MSNMSYCRFRNTLPDLRDCENYIYDECESEDEEKARKRMIILCKKIVDNFEPEEIESFKK